MLTSLAGCVGCRERGRHDQKRSNGPESRARAQQERDDVKYTASTRGCVSPALGALSATALPQEQRTNGLSVRHTVRGLLGRRGQHAAGCRFTGEISVEGLPALCQAQLLPGEFVTNLADTSEKC